MLEKFGFHHFILLLLLLAGLACLALSSRPLRMPGDFEVAKVHNLIMALSQYATDHDGQYPVGSTSTAVFQQLYDGHYLNDVGDLVTGKRPQSDVPKQLLAADVFCDAMQAANRPISTKDPGELLLVVTKGLDPATLKDGPNPFPITRPEQSPLGSNGVIAGYLDGSSRFVLSDDGQPALVNLTDFDFKVPPNTSYHTVTP